MGRRGMQWNALLLALCVSGALGSPSPAPSPDPEPGVAFYRGAVESSLRQGTSPSGAASSSATVDEEYGSMYLPLRSSVESVPLKSLRELEEHRVPLRDAVESRPDEQTLAALRAAYASQVSESSSLQTPVTSGTEYKQYYGAASHFNENKKSDRLQQGNMNLEEMRQTATGAAERRLVVCYVQGWAAYRSPPLAFTAGLVPTSCTHLHYAFATLHPHSYAVTPTDHDYDVVRGGYRSVTGLRLSRPGLRVLLSVGGVGSERLLAEMASDHARRAAFVESAVAFIKEYEFDGLDLHWAYPGETEAHEKDHLTALLYELREKFTPHDFTLSVILPSSRYLIEDGYDLPAVSGAADYAVLQAWDMHAENRNDPPRRAFHHSPLHQDPAASSTRESRFENVEYAVKYLLRGGMAKEKLVLGVPIFGRSFTLSNSAIFKPGAFVSGWGTEGLYTQNRGLLAYFEICMAVREGRGTVRVDSAGNSYAVLGDQWVGFDNVQSIAEKMRFAVRTGLAGGAAWAVDMDDFRGLCGDKWPLVTAMAQAINDQPVRPSESQLKRISFCERDSAYLSSDASSCAQFTLCSGGVEYRLSCEDNTLYDPTTGRCGHLDANRCVPGQSLRITIVEASKLLLSQNNEGEVDKVETLETSQRVVMPSKYQPAAETTERMSMDTIPMPEITTVSHELATSDSNTSENAFTNAQSLEPVSNEVPNEVTVFAEDHPTSNIELAAQGVNESELAPWHNEENIAGSNIEQTVSQGKQNDKRVVCYMTNWSFYRRGEGKFVPEHVDTRLCTHLVYAYATLTPDTLVAKEFDPWTDIDNNLFERVTSLKDLKVLLGLGGWTDSAGDKYSRLVSSGAARRTFVSNLIAFLRQHHFSGVHLDWNYPVCWQSDCKKGPTTDKANFAKLIQELSSELHAAGMEVGVAVSGYKEIIERAYDLRSLSASADFLSAMTYDYHGGWETSVAHPTPLSARTGDSLPAYSIEYAIKALISGGANPKKLLLGLSFYGQTYRLEEVEGTAVPGTAASGPGEPGEFTKQPGMMAYYEICYRMKNLRWQSGRQSDAGPYAYSRDQWVGYDDQMSIKEKVEWGLQQGLGGVTAWTVDLDDFSNRCCAEPSPLLRAANRALGRSTPAPPTTACARPPAPVTPAPPTTTTVDDMGGGGSHHNHGQGSATTWPSWSPAGTSPSTPTTAQTWWPTPAPTTSTSRAPSTTTRAPTTTSTTTTTAATTVALPPPVSSDGTMEKEKCDGKMDDYRAAAGDCGSYLQCVGGVWRKQRCAPGLHWSANNNRCDWPSSAKCTMKHNDPPSWSTTTTLAPTTARPPRPTPTTTTTSTTTTPAPPPPTTAAPTLQPAGDSGAVMENERCDGKAGDYHGAAGECESYLQCVAGVWHKQRCAPGLHWNAASTRCDWPRAAKCTSGNMAPVTPAPTTSTTTTSTTVAPPATPEPARDEPVVLKPGSPCQTGTYHAHPRCSKFFICVNGALVAQSCAPGLQWNSKRSMCDFPAQAACVERQAPAPGKDQAERDKPPAPTPAPSADSPPSAAIVEQPMSMSSCSDGSYSSYPGDCSRYRHCMWGKYEEFRCSAGLHWNQEKLICDWPKHAHCTEGEATSLDEDTFHVSNTQPAPAAPLPPPSYHPAPTVEPTTQQPTTTTLTIVDKPDIVKSPYKLVCYFTNWAWYRPGLGKYVPEDIDSTLCTHVIYGFAVLGYEGTITAHDSWADYDNRFYERVVAYKKHGIKVSLALGGWNDSAGDKYSKLVNNPSARAKFVTHAVQFLEKYGFDGLDLDWEYPKCWQVDCSKGPDSDKEGFSALVRELSTAFKPKGLLLSSAVSPNKKVIDAGYDVPVLAEYMDWIAVMTYDYHGQWDKKTGHVAPLYYHPEDDTTYFNSNYTMHYWMEMGAPPSKLVMGMPLYGQAFTLGTQWDTPPELLAKANETGLNVPARSGGEAGEFTRAKGFLAYYEICERLKNRAWTVVRDPAGRMGPYAFRGDQWVSFDDVEIIRKKVKFIRSLNLAGGMVWALDLDDFRNRCGEGKHPLLTTIRNGLLEATTKEELIASAALQSLPEKPADVQVPQSIESKPESPPPVAPPTVEESGVVSSGTSSAVEPPNDGGNSIGVPVDSSEYKVVCYFTNWAWYRPGPGKYTPGDIDPSLCTHIVYAFAVLDRDRLTIKPHDSWADIDNKFYEKVVALRSRGIKVLLGVGGWNDSAGDKYSRLVNSATARRTFLVQAIDFIEQYHFDGLDLDWEYPKCWQVDCNKGPASDKEGFSALVKELRAAFTPKQLLLSAAVSPSKRVIDNGYDVPVLNENLDWIAVMTYDYHGQWDKKTGHVAPMYVRDDDTDRTFNANFTINYWISEGASRRKIVMGFPMYGQSFSLAEGGDKGLDAATYGGGEAGDETRARGFLAFYEICERIRVRGWNVIRDPSGRMGPYATKGDQWVSFDDDFMIHHKAEYVRAMGLGGGMIWALDLDDFNGKYCGCGKSPLLSTINSVLRGREAPPSCALDGPPEPAVVTAAPPTPSAEAPPAESPSKPEPESPEGNEVSPENESCSGNSFKPDPLDCGKYYLCNNGKYTQLPCPHPLHWNQDRCDWPSKSNCPKGKAQIRKADSEEAKEPMIVCYFTNWAFYRKGNGSYSPQEVDASLCTHVVYAWSALHRDTLTIAPRDTNVDIDNDFYGKMSALRLKGVKVLMGVGGWQNSAGGAWSRLVRSPERREAFIDSVLEFLRRWHFDGIEVSWQYPVCWQASCDEAESHADDRDGFSALMVELSSSLKPRGFLLSAGVAASRAVASLAYHVSDVVAAADWLTVAAYDYHGAWEPHTAHGAPVTPLTSHDTDNIKSSLNYWLEAGVPPSKLVLGVPFYGHSYTLRDAAAQGLGAPAAGPGEPGPLTGVPGFLAYHEICSGIRSGLWTATHTPQGSYACRDLQWVSYADEADVWRAVRAGAALGARGAAAWALDLDDWRGTCGCGPHPLLRALRRTLLDPDAQPTSCRAP